jgi:hypothetical protein
MYNLQCLLCARSLHYYLFNILCYLHKYFNVENLQLEKERGTIGNYFGGTELIFPL